MEGRSGQCNVPADRFNVDAFYHPNGPDRPGSMSTKGGYFVDEDIRNFENDFFGINNLEATYMDPQQRKLLEVTFECFESAGIPLEKASGSNTGCYVGNFTVDFQTMQTRDAEYFHRYSATGLGNTILGNRISHAFNLTGPSCVIDTACSSTLYCLHMACAALENEECDAAVVAGANLIQSPEQHMGTNKAGVLSRTSTCHTFDASADGYGRADGVGALYLKRLSDAIRDGDPIRSVIRGTAINANGHTQGITLPSADGQHEVIKKAYKKAGLSLDDTAYVECHGTGTPVGDPIEVEAVSRTFGRNKSNRMLIGSVKSNLGHSEAASAISSLIKLTLALENSYIPATIGIKQINPKIKCDEWGVEIVSEGRPWPAPRSLRIGNYVRRAGVNSFGYGGANAHAILENASAHIPSNYGRASIAQEMLGSRKSFLLPFSATSEESLTARVEDMNSLDLDHVSILDLAYTLCLRRSHLRERGTMVVTREDLQNGLKAEDLQKLAMPPIDSPSNYAFVFTGQGAQWPQMCKELFDEFQVFRNSIAEMDAVLRSLPNAPTWTIREAILEGKETSSINEVSRSQTCCTAIQVGLVQLLASWNITPSAVIGHSSGEISAAFAAGYISAAQAIATAYYRGYVVSLNQMDGAMMAAGMSQEEAVKAINDSNLSQNIRVACVNSPESVTISGDASAIGNLLETLQARKLFARMLVTGGRAYHSHHMLALGEEYQRSLQAVTGSLGPSSKMPTGAAFVSSVTGKVISPSDVGPAYWRKNLESPVLFSTAVSVLSKDGRYHLIELGPHSALQQPIKQTRTKLGVKEEAMPYSAAILRSKNAVDCVLNLAGRLYLHGNSVAFERINDLQTPGKKESHRYNYKVLTDLPRYRWSYEATPLWNEPRASLEFRKRQYPRHELLGSRIPGGNGSDLSWRNILRLEDIPWLKDHRLNEAIVIPGAGYLAMAVEALSQAYGEQGTKIESISMKNFNILSALPISEASGAQVEVFTTLQPTQISHVSVSESWWNICITSYNDGVSTTHASATLRASSKSEIQQPLYQPQDDLEVTAARVWYEKLIKEGLNFGPDFQTITEVHVPRFRSTRHCTTKARSLQQVELLEYPIHPITLDAMLQTAIIATTSGKTNELEAKVPTRFGSVDINLLSLAEQNVWSIQTETDIVGFGAANIRAELLDSNSRVAVRFEDVKLSPYKAAAPSEDDAIQRHPMLRVIWKPDTSVGLVNEAGFTRYLDGFVAEAHSEFNDEGILKLAACLDLISHRNPSSHILELGNDVEPLTQAALGLLGADQAFKKLAGYTKADILSSTEMRASSIDLTTGKFSAEQPTEIKPDYDMILLPTVAASEKCLFEHLDKIQTLLAPRGVVVAIAPTINEAQFRSRGLVPTVSPLKNGSGSIILAHRQEDDMLDKSVRAESIVLVDNGTNSLVDALVHRLSDVFGREIQRVAFQDVSEMTILPGAIVLSTIESEIPVLANTSDDEMRRIKIITDRASILLWVTGGDLLAGKSPDHSLVQGLSRALMMEQPSLKFLTFDVDDISTDSAQTASNIVSVLKCSAGGLLDFEYIQRAGTIHVSRFTPDDGINNAFRRKQGDEKALMPLKNAKPAQISIQNPGQFDTVYFKQLPGHPDLKPHDVQVAVKAIGLNAKDFYALGGKVDTQDASCSLEFCGVVEQVGSDVTNVVPGDRVVVMAVTHFRTSETVPDWTCQKLEESEDFNVMCTLPLVYSTAIYALQIRANIQAGETVLIHSGAGGVGIAAIQLAKRAGAEIFTTVSTDAKKQYLVENFGLEPSHVLSSRGTAFMDDILKATGGRGVDIVLNSLTGDQLHASWRCCAEFGRFIEIGKRDLIDAGRLEMEQFLKHATFTAFDLSGLYFSENERLNMVWSKLVQDTIAMYRRKEICEFPVEIFDVSEVTNALRAFSSRNRMGKVCLLVPFEGNIANPRLDRRQHGERQF